MTDDKIFREILNIPEGMNWHQAQDAKMADYASPRACAWHYVNDVVAQNWVALESPVQHPSDEEELASCLVEIHNDAVERINQNLSPVRHWALIDEVRLRLRGLLTPDVTLISWTGLTPLPARPLEPKGEPVPIRERLRPDRA